MKTIALLGSTGSIGVNVLNIVRSFPSRYRIVGLAAGRNIALLSRQINEFQPEIVSVVDEEHARQLRKLVARRYHDRIVFGIAGNEQVAAHHMAEFTVSAIVGAAGLLPTLAAIEAGKNIGLANKETLVMAGKYVMERAQKKSVRLLPIDSEHSAIFQALEGGRRQDIKKIILTASGGPFRETPASELSRVTPKQALNHPNWSMGKKITIDSATLMNKGLEVIEAKWLFGVSGDMIEVVVHPQSIVHSLVEYLDGSVLAQLGLPDMRVPIAYALSYPERLQLELDGLNLSQCRDLEFFEPDHKRFPALGLAFEALSQGGVLPAVLNGANEVAVEAFLQGQLSFEGISQLVEQTMNRVSSGDELNLDDILQADQEARVVARQLL